MREGIIPVVIYIIILTFILELRKSTGCLYTDITNDIIIYNSKIIVNFNNKIHVRGG